MSIPRLFTDHDLAADAVLAGMPGHGHYLGGVMRLGPGAVIRLFNGRDGEWDARIESVRRDDLRLQVVRRLRAQRAAPDIRLLLAALKRDAMEWAVEKATELGAALIQPVLTARCVSAGTKPERLLTIAREAAEQCERLDLPRIPPALPLHAVLDHWDGAPLAIGAERGAAPPLGRVLAGRAAPAGLLVGPEGGFTAAELDALGRHPFCVAVSLGPRILRAETAAVAGLAVLQSACGDWGEDRV